MKSILTIFCIAMCLTISSYAQTNFPFSETMSFYSSESGLKLEKVKQYSVLLPNKSLNNVSHYNVSGSDFQHYLSFVEEDENSVQNTYILDSKHDVDLMPRDPQKSYDTLFFKLDQDYSGTKYLAIGKEINNGGFMYPTWITSTLGYRLIEHGTINVVALLGSGLNEHIVFRENIQFNGKDTLFLASSDANHAVNFEPVTEEGILFDDLTQIGQYTNKYTMTFDVSNGGVAVISIEMSRNKQLYVSDYTGAIYLCFGSAYRDARLEWKNYLIEYPLINNITESITFANAPSNYSSTVLNFDYHGEYDYSMIGLGRYSKYISAIDGKPTIFGLSGFQERPCTEYWETTLFMDMIDSEKIGYCSDYTVKRESDFYASSPFFDTYNDSIAGFYENLYYADAHTINNLDTLKYGYGTSFYWPVWDFSGNKIYNESDNIGIYGNFYFRDFETDKYFIRDKDENIIHEGSGLVVQLYNVEPDEYILEQVNKNCQFDNYSGSSILRSTFNTSLVDKVPPPVRQVQILNGENTLKYHFDFGEEVLFKFSASDFKSYDYRHVGYDFKPIDESLTTVSYKLYDSNDWIEINTQVIYRDSIIGSQYYTNFTEYLGNDPAMYDIKFYVEDYSGNSSEYTFSPAFVYGNFIVGIPEHSNNENRSEAIIIHPNPTHHSITITTSAGDLNKVNNFEILSMNGDVHKKGIINQTRNSIDINDLASGIYIISLFDGVLPVMSKKLIKLD